MQKTLIIIRHAHRDKIAEDNGLSEKGQKQAKRARDFYRERYKDTPAVLRSSPKIRCVETLQPLAKDLGVKIAIDPLLDEGDRLQPRLKQFLKEWMASKEEMTVISSHGDWIPEFLEAATGVYTDLSKGGWAELQMEGNAAKLTWLVQEP